MIITDTLSNLFSKIKNGYLSKKIKNNTTKFKTMYKYFKYISS